MNTINQLAAIVANVLRDCKRADIDVTDVMMLASEKFAKEPDIYSEVASAVYAGTNAEDGTLATPAADRVVASHPALGMGYGKDVEVIECAPTPEGLAIIEAAVAANEAHKATPRGQEMAAWPTFTCWVMETNRTGTAYVSSFQCADIETAKEQALLECALNWGRGDDVDDLFVLGVAAGNVDILEWDDDC